MTLPDFKQKIAGFELDAKAGAAAKPLSLDAPNVACRPQSPSHQGQIEHVEQAE